MEFKEDIGTITIDSSYLQNAEQSDLEALAVCQTELGRILSRILVSNKQPSGINIYTMRPNDFSPRITVHYVKTGSIIKE